MLKDLKYRYKSANALLKLIYINLAVFVLVQIVNTSSFLFQSNSINLVYGLGMPSEPGELLFKPWTIITYMFTHTGLLHILFNLIWLYFSNYNLQNWPIVLNAETFESLGNDNSLCMIPFHYFS